MADSPTGTVVVVEDDASMCQALERNLRLAGLKVATYRSAEAFLDARHATNTMCMIIDVQLPGINGFTLRKRLAAQGAVPPVIFITAFDTPDARAQAVQAGAAAFLTKPFAARTLLEAIEAMQCAPKNPPPSDGAVSRKTVRSPHEDH
jgi:FixJ family two-component response regulator